MEKMNIEIAEPGRMTQSGSSLLKLIQNNNMPILDLLVRESIQNSLDAADKEKDYVTVEFMTGSFKKIELNKELDQVTNSLNSRYPNEKYNYIAIKDSNTVGLTGKLHYDEVIDNQYGNLLKLIYEISKPQEAEGAGGSWGLGKTVYFRVGIGLVLYYSRIINESGEYESRLAASLVENEMDNNALIPTWNGKAKRGIAWWGEKIGENQTRPITDEEYIKHILDIFGMNEYTGEETGTTIIIPYIDDDYLLNNNQIEYRDGEDNSFRPSWRCNVEEYLKIAIQRWYAPRLNNKYYKYGRFLRAKVNDTGIGYNSMEPAFKIVQALYNRAIKADIEDDILEQKNCETKVDDIVLRKVLKSSKAGFLAYTKVGKDVLKIGYPDNKPEPYMYFNCEIREKEKNKPVVFFTRKPGMIVSYEDVGNWVDGINSSEKGEYIMAIFVLDSENELACDEPGYSLEEYIRKSEMADHTSWGDFSIGKFNPRIVSKVQGQVNSKISKEFFAEEENTISKFNSGLGKMFGDILLPPENFGKKPSGPVGPKPKPGPNLTKHKNILFGYDSSNITYFTGGMYIDLIIQIKKEVLGTGFSLAIDSESGAILYNEWENKMGLKMPFSIEEILFIYSNDEDDEKREILIDEKNCSIQSEGMLLLLKKSNKGYGCGLNISFEELKKMNIKIRVKLNIYRRDIKPVFVLEKEV